MSLRIEFERRLKLKKLYEDFSSALARIKAKQEEVEALPQAMQDVISDKIDDTADYIERHGPISQIKSYFVDKKQFSLGDFETLEKLLKKEDDKSLSALTSYIQNPVSVDFFTKITKPLNMGALFSKTFPGMNSSLINTFVGMEGRQKSGKGVGKGELFLGLMIKDATNAAEGDVNVNGQPYEVKAREARLNTQNGFGIGSSALAEFFDQLARLDSDIRMEFGEKTKENYQSYNFKKNDPSRFYELFSACVNKGIKLDKVLKLVANTVFVGPSGIWPNGSGYSNMIFKAFKKYVKKDGSAKDDKMLNYNLMYINILYYQSQEYFHGIFLVNPNNGNLAYFNPSMGESKGVKWLSSYVKYTQPSWQDRPTSDAWKIKLN